MTTSAGIVRTVLAVATGLVLAADAAVVIHDFYTYADRAVYAAVDDGLANIAYSLTAHGRYSFPASPILAGLSRMDGQFNYGPWYFYIAAAVIWLFGYSLTAVRAIHLWVVVGCAAAAPIWFRRGPDRAASGALAGFGVLFFFGTTEWPMARPDSLVSAFAVVLIVAAGLGLSRGKPLYWFIAGLAAACGAFTHLIAGSMLVSVVALFAVFAAHGHNGAVDARQAARRTRAAALALLAGLLLGVAMFYASFGFNFAAQWHHLTDYRKVTSTSEPYLAAVMHHFRIAFGFYPAWLRQSVWLTLGVAWLITAAALVRRSEARRVVFTYLLPPTVVWTLYLLSNGKYTNYHQGYAILHHVMFVWTAAAIIRVAIDALGGRRPLTAAAAGTLVAVLVLVHGVLQLQRHIQSPPRASQADHRVAFGEYVDRVLGGIPAGARAWGSVFFGIESPDRVQLVQQDDAVTLMQKIDSGKRAGLEPDYLIWGYPEARDDTMAALAGAPTRVAAMEQLLPDGFRLVSLVDGKPYGVTRVYARTAGPPAADRAVPAVAMYDDVHQQWLDRMGPALPIDFRAVPPATLQIGYETAPAGRTATATVTADMPPGRYWLKVRVRSGPGPAARLIAVTSWTMARQTISELRLTPAGDYAGYLPDDRDVFAVIAHPGGGLFVSQFDGSSGAGIEAVTIGRVLDRTETLLREARVAPLPDFTSWQPMPGVKMVFASGRLRVEGDASSSGYQLYSPVIPATPGEFVEVDVPSTVERAAVCVGVLNAAGNWLVMADEWREQIDFHADSSQGFRVTFANCQFTGEPLPSRFTLRGGSYIRRGAVLYADRFVGRALEQGRPAAADSPGPPAVRFPSQPLIVVGSARSDDGFLVRADPRYLDTETRLLVAGHLQKGNVSIGLLQNGDWASRTTVTEPGEFMAMLAPAANGMYTVAVAGDTPGGATIDRTWLLPAVRPAK